MVECPAELWAFSSNIFAIRAPNDVWHIPEFFKFTRYFEPFFFALWWGKTGIFQHSIYSIASFTNDFTYGCFPNSK